MTTDSPAGIGAATELRLPEFVSDAGTPWVEAHAESSAIRIACVRCITSEAVPLPAKGAPVENAIAHFRRVHSLCPKGVRP